LELALERARSRRAFGRPLADYQALQWALADAATELEAARLLAYAAAAAIDAGGDASVAAAHAKKFAPAAALRHLATCIQVMAAACGGGAPARANATQRPVVVGTPTYLTPAPPAATPPPDPSSPARVASGGRTAITCRIPVSAYQPGSGGFVSMPSGQFTSDPA